MEKCVIATIRKKYSKEYVEDQMLELEQLVEASGGQVVCQVIQDKDRPDGALYLGKGKVGEIKAVMEETESDLLVINDELSGSQIRNLEKFLETRVIDRTMLILDIFALRAQTRESKLQVELAQLKYSIPRLKGKGIDMSRLGGGIGTRGPGEKQLETDRRHIESRVYEIEKQLKKSINVREENRKSRIKNNVPVIAVVGYTNAGKSTLINTMLSRYGVEKDKQVFVYDQLFATLTTENRKLKLQHHYEAIITDTVGFVNQLPTQLVESFKSTLEEITHSDLIIHLMDSTNHNLALQKSTTEKILSDIDAIGIPKLDVYNKADQLTHINGANQKELYISAKTGFNLERLEESILNIIYGKTQIYHQHIDFNDYGDLNFIENKTDIISREHDETGTNITFKTREKIYERYIGETHHGKNL